MIKPISFLLFLNSCLPLFYQKSEVKIGIGNYEAFNLGLRHNFEKLNFEYGIGTDFNVHKQGFYNVVHVGIEKEIFKKISLKNNQLLLNSRVFLWNIKNRSNIFTVFAPSIGLINQLKLSEKIKLGIHAGVLWNTVIRYERLTFQDVGYPKEWQANFGICLYYKIK